MIHIQTVKDDKHSTGHLWYCSQNTQIWPNIVETTLKQINPNIKLYKNVSDYEFNTLKRVHEPDQVLKHSGHEKICLVPLGSSVKCNLWPKGFSVRLVLMFEVFFPVERTPSSVEIKSDISGTVMA